MQLDQLPFGVTCLKWSPCGKFLWAGGRNSDRIQCWDIRSSGSCLGEVRRSLNTQQRMTFDIDPWGDYLASGADDGQVLIYNTSTFELVTQFPNRTDGGSSSCVNTVLFHPYSSVLYTVQGVRSFNGVGETDCDSDSEHDNEAMTVSEGAVPVKRRKYTPPISAISLWSMNFTPLPMPLSAEAQVASEQVTSD